MEKYEILKGSQVVGHAELEQKGLYYRIECVMESDQYLGQRIEIAGEGNGTDLGICIPFPSFCGIKTSVPVKTVGTGQIRFQIKSTQSENVFVPIKPGEPVVPLHQIISGKFGYCGGQPGIWFPKGI